MQTEVQLTLQTWTTIHMHCNQASVPGCCRPVASRRSRLLAIGRRSGFTSLHWLFCLYLDAVAVAGAAPSRICQRLLCVAAARLAGLVSGINHNALQPTFTHMPLSSRYCSTLAVIRPSCLFDPRVRYCLLGSAFGRFHAAPLGRRALPSRWLPRIGSLPHCRPCGRCSCSMLAVRDGRSLMRGCDRLWVCGLLRLALVAMATNTPGHGR